MKYWLVNQSWEMFRQNNNYCVFESNEERQNISIGDKIVYFGSGMLLGVFQATGMELGKNKNQMDAQNTFLIKINPVLLPENEIVARPLYYKTILQKPAPNSKSIFRLSESEFEKIKAAIVEKKSQLIF